MSAPVNAKAQRRREALLLLHCLVGCCYQRFRKCLRCSGIEIDPHIEGAVEFSGLAHPKFDFDPTSGPFRIRRARIDAVELQHASGAGFEGRYGIAQFLRERYPVRERTP